MSSLFSAALLAPGGGPGVTVGTAGLSGPSGRPPLFSTQQAGPRPTPGRGSTPGCHRPKADTINLSQFIMDNLPGSLHHLPSSGQGGSSWPGGQEGYTGKPGRLGTSRKP